jgi:membrane-associated protease RseP (regulator of RpoE activity)
MRDPLGDTGPVEARKAIRGGILLALAVAVAIALRPSIWVSLAIVGGLIATIMLHELGHYVAAKRAGMKVTEFFLGFGPRLWSVRVGETEVGVKAIPAGGYVRIVGMNNTEVVDPADETRTYRASTTPRKLAVVLAGITVNLLVAFVLVYVVLVGRGLDRLTTTVERVVPGMPAATAGLRAGDRVVAIDGRPTPTWEDLTTTIRRGGLEPRVVTVERGRARLDVTVTPELAGGAPRIGVESRTTTERVHPVAAVPRAGAFLWQGTVATVDALGRVFSPSGIERYGRTVTEPGGRGGFSGDERPVSVIGIVAEGSGLVDGNVWVLLALLAAVNVFLALFNLIPLPPFDGGHAAVAAYEAVASRITRRRVVVDYRKLMPVAATVFVLLLVFGLSTMYLDVRQIITGS